MNFFYKKNICVSVKLTKLTKIFIFCIIDKSRNVVMTIRFFLCFSLLVFNFLLICEDFSEKVLGSPK